MKKIILALALLGMLQTTVAQKKKKSTSKATSSKSTSTSEPEAKTYPVTTTTSTSSSSNNNKTSESTSKAKTTSSKSSTSSGSSGQEGFRSGDIFISGSFGYVSKKEGDVSTSKTSILPSLGYFLKDNIALVGTIGFENTDAGGTSTSAFVIGAAARYYVTPAAKFSLFGQAGIGFKSAKDLTVLTIGVKPGLNYFLNDHFSVEATVGEIGIINTSVGSNSNTDFNFGADLSQIGLGLNYKF